MKIKKSISLGSIIYLLGMIYGFYSGVTTKLISLDDINPQEIDFISLISHNIGVIGMMFLGIVSFGIISLSILFINGVSLGVTLGSFWGTKYFMKILLVLLPHGVLEIPGFIIACAGDILILFSVIYVSKRNKNKSKENFKKGILLNILAIIVMILAGVIETYTPIPRL